MILVTIFYILSGFLTYIYAYKTDEFPPLDLLFKHYTNVDYSVKTCYERSGVDRKELMEFEMTEDLEHIPNSPALKSYLRCYAEINEIVEKKSNKLMLAKAGAFLVELTNEQKDIYFRMGKGCAKRQRDVKDPIEFTYGLYVCYKQNSNEHFYIFY